MVPSRTHACQPPEVKVPGEKHENLELRMRASAKSRKMSGDPIRRLGEGFAYLRQEPQLSKARSCRKKSRGEAGRRKESKMHGWRTDSDDLFFTALASFPRRCLVREMRFRREAARFEVEVVWMPCRRIVHHGPCIPMYPCQRTSCNGAACRSTWYYSTVFNLPRQRQLIRT